MQVLLDNPTESSPVPRHSSRLSDVTLTHLVIPKLPRAIGTSGLRKQWQAAEVDKNWSQSNWAKTREDSHKRRALTDFERFKVMRMRKAHRLEVRKNLAKIRASAKA